MSLNRRLASSLALRASSKLFWIEAVRLRNIAGKFFFDAHAIKPGNDRKIEYHRQPVRAIKTQSRNSGQQLHRRRMLELRGFVFPRFGSGLGLGAALAGAFWVKDCGVPIERLGKA